MDVPKVSAVISMFGIADFLDWLNYEVLNAFGI